MVRWAYINQITPTASDCNLLGTIKFEKNFKNYLRTYIVAHPVTKIKRRVYTRRKHLYNWSTYFNLLARWSADYRFRLKYLSALIEPNLFTYRYLTFNQTAISAKSYAFFKTTREFKAGVVTKAITSYTTNLARPGSFYLPTSFNSFLHLTTWKSTFWSSSDKTVLLGLSFLNSNHTFYAIPSVPHDTTFLADFLRLPFTLYLVYLKTIYRLLTLLLRQLLL